MFYEKPLQIDGVKKGVQEKIIPAVKGIHCMVQRQGRYYRKEVDSKKHQVLQNVTGIVNLVESLWNLIITWNWAWKSFILHSVSLVISHHHTKTLSNINLTYTCLLQVNMWFQNILTAPVKAIVNCLLQRDVFKNKKTTCLFFFFPKIFLNSDPGYKLVVIYFSDTVEVFNNEW